MQIRVGSPIKPRHSNAFSNDTFKSSFENLDLGVELVDDLGLAGLVDEDTAESHFEGRAL